MARRRGFIGDPIATSTDIDRARRVFDGSCNVQARGAPGWMKRAACERSTAARGQSPSGWEGDERPRVVSRGFFELGRGAPHVDGL
jgi:hypothetical protein